ncbi:hypothetical protein ACX1N5_01530 [Acinetobacter sp. ANC 4636]
MKLTKELKCNWWLIGIFVFLIWITFPYLFKLSMSWMGLFGAEFKNFADYGPVGDVYGSLNTLISSIALCAVAYSTWLQVTSLKETREATTRQLNLAEKNHQEQLKESQYAIFTNMINNLLAHKNESKKSLTIKNDGETYDHEHIFNHMYKQFLKRVESDWSQLNEITRFKIMEDFLDSIDELSSNKLHVSTLLITYFKIYESIFDLVKSSVLTEQEKDFYYHMVGKTMSLSEQACLLWVTTGFEEVAEYLEDTGIFWFNFEKEIEFIYKFHQRSYFCNSLFLQAWDEFEKNQTPT